MRKVRYSKKEVTDIGEITERERGEKSMGRAGHGCKIKTGSSASVGEVNENEDGKGGRMKLREDSHRSVREQG